MTAPLSSTGTLGQEATAAEQSRMELQAKLNGLGGLNGRKLDPEAKAKKLREACEGFESIFIQKMWQEMRKAVPQTGILTGREERFWQDMYDQELSKSMTKAGGIGLADMMYEQLSRNLVSASRSAAGSATGGAFVPSAAPLLPEEQATDTENLNPATLAASIYDGEAEAVSSQANAEAAPAQPNPVSKQTPGPLTQTALYDPAPNTAYSDHGVKKTHAADLNQSTGMLNAQKAKRDAGDKLGSNAVRPLRANNAASKRKQEQSQPAQSQPAAFQPGSPEALKAAMELAKTGAMPEQTGKTMNLSQLVANVQSGNIQTSPITVAGLNPEADGGAIKRTVRFTTNKTGRSQPVNLRNIAASGQTGNMQESQGEQFNDALINANLAADAEPVKRTVRYTTNVPQASKANGKAKQAIRMLNVDNVGANSKAGQGLAAYHAQQEALKQSQPAQTVAQQTPIAPLTGQTGQTDNGASGNFAIPPLTAMDAAG